MKGKVLAVDYGTKRVGVATGDLEFKIAFPRMVLRNKGDKVLIEDLKAIIEELGVSVVVVGLPLCMEDEYEENEILGKVRGFVELFEKMVNGVKFELFDERLSSFEADSLIDDLILKGDKSIGRDAYAAQVILKRYFDAT